MCTIIMDKWAKGSALFWLDLPNPLRNLEYYNTNTGKNGPRELYFIAKMADVTVTVFL